MNTIKLSNGVDMPVMAIGTNWMEYDDLKKILIAGFNAGFRAIDTARDYGNEHIVGKALHDALLDVGLKRHDVFLTTKIGNGQQVRGDISDEINISLDNLQTDYVDLWLMHWPYPGYYVGTWKKMETVYEQHKVRAIGVANYDIRHFNKLFQSDIKICPMVNQMEYHPLRTVPELVRLLKDNDIKIQAYAPLCRLVSPLKDNQQLCEIAKRHNKSLGQVILRWHVQQGMVMPVFKSYKPSRFTENIDIFDFTLSEEEMRFIFSLNMDYKYHLESASCPGY